MDEREKKIKQYNKLTREELGKALVNNKEKLADMNEFRGQQKDMIVTLATRIELNMLREKVSDLENFQAKIMGVIALILFIMPLIFWLLNYSTTYQIGKH